MRVPALPAIAPRTLIAFASAGLVATIALVNVERTSPGPIAHAHGQLEELAGGSSCSACHGGWTTSMTSACLECHPAIDEQITAGKGLHGTPPEGGTAFDPLACGNCHSEHHGADFPLVNARSFALIGVPDEASFDHARIGWTMDGRHLELACLDCHAFAESKYLAEGEHRYLGLDASCATCHADPHEGAFSLACSECHVQSSFDEHVSVGHERHLALIGGHAGLACRDCHVAGDLHSLEVLAGGGARPSARGCADCHESPHEPSFVEAIARSEGVPRARSCATCHAQEHLAFDSDGATVTVEQHALTGFELAAPHALGDSVSDGPSCADCHDPSLATFAERYPGREALDCASCHDDPHAGQFADGPFADPTKTGGGCVACHAPEGFAPHRFDLELHARAAFAVDGAHASLACDECHVIDGDGGVRRFRGTPARCEACHDDVHEPVFDPRGAELLALADGTCARCHGTASFARDPGAEFDHAHFTGFALDGAHAAESCEVCHPCADEPGPEGRTFGRVGDRFGAFAATFGAGAHVAVEAACAVCHADPHGGTFDAAREARLASPQAKRDGDEVVGCARCHAESSFRELVRDFDHGAETGFPLDGAHAAAACSACHAPLAEPDPRGRTMDVAAGPACADCHADPHAGQFARRDALFPEGGTDCSRCHHPAEEEFRAVGFDHDIDSRFPLDGSHRALACSACHRPERMDTGAGERELVRYRPLGRQCVDCHGDQSGPLRRRTGGRRG